MGIVGFQQNFIYKKQMADCGLLFYYIFLKYPLLHGDVKELEGKTYVNRSFIFCILMYLKIYFWVLPWQSSC